MAERKIMAKVTVVFLLLTIGFQMFILQEFREHIRLHRSIDALYDARWKNIEQRLADMETRTAQVSSLQNRSR